VSDDINKLEPVSPTVAFVRHAGDTGGRTADYDAYIQDLEDRTARTAASRRSGSRTNRRSQKSS
jgi:hypothetical protein